MKKFIYFFLFTVKNGQFTKLQGGNSDESAKN